MEFSLDQRTAELSVGELADFQIGPRESGDGQSGLWRAQLGTHWHQELRAQMGAEQKSALFEIPLSGKVFHKGWTITLTGRIDQLIPPQEATGTARAPAPARLREIKSVMRALPAEEEELRAEYPGYFAQLATYLALGRLHAPIHEALTPSTPLHGELVFVEAGSGLTQTLAVTAQDENSFQVQLERLTEFLNLRLRARERLRNLSFSPAFAELRPGQETIQQDLAAALREHPVVFFEAPTGFGKTGVLLEQALKRLKSGQHQRVIYLTSKSTGQLQVVRQLGQMTRAERSSTGELNGQTLAAWHVRNKREHCVNAEFHCVRESCRFLNDLERRWKQSDLSRFYLVESTDRSIEALRSAGANACICPYEITRTSLAFNDVWVGDYNYVFAPGNRGLFYDQPGFTPKETLLIIDEAHNLPQRVADAHSHAFNAGDASAAAEALYRCRAYAPLVTAWDHWTHFLRHLKPCEQLPAADQDDGIHLLEQIGKHVSSVPLDYVELGAHTSEMLWQVPSLLSQLERDLPRLWWSPRVAELSITCLDAAEVIGPTLRTFGASILASATFGPPDVFAASCGLEPREFELKTAEGPGKFGALTKRETKKLFKNVSSGAQLLGLKEAEHAERPAIVRAPTPWRDRAYDVAVDLRVETTYQQRTRHMPMTAATIEDLCAAAARSTETRCIAVFFPSYSYAEAVQRSLSEAGSALKVSLQPRAQDLAAQYAWVEESLLLSDALFLVLGSSFAEGIDVLGGRIQTAMVVGPALPEVNAVQKARLAEQSALGRDAAFRRVYQVPGIQKVNQALGRLVRAPGQHARILLHCRRFGESAYASLLGREYQFGKNIHSDEELAEWLEAPAIEDI
jgi:DNA excision repair protein ERCC-2